jgi:excisionase family DNA binding protein
MKAYLTVEKIMGILQISRTTAYGLISSRRLKSYKVGRLVRIREIDLKHFIEGKPSRKNKK